MGSDCSHVFAGVQCVVSSSRYPAAMVHAQCRCAQCLAHWERVKDQERWGAAWGLQAIAAADRAELALGAYMDTIYHLVQPHALAFQRRAAASRSLVSRQGSGWPSWDALADQRTSFSGLKARKLLQLPGSDTLHQTHEAPESGLVIAQGWCVSRGPCPQDDGLVTTARIHNP